MRDEILRVFPRRTKATPDDRLAHVGYPDLFSGEMYAGVTEIHISVTFTWDLYEAYNLAEAWSKYGNVKIGGPATEIPGGEFTPGKYLKKGWTITSRGCPNSCWFCKVPEREIFRELIIYPGDIVQDDNLLACSEKHIRAVFEMLSTRRKRDINLRGLEAHLLRPYHVELLRDLNPNQVFFAYDTPEDYEPLLAAAAMFREIGWANFRKLRCYNLIGWEGDTLAAAEERLKATFKAGFLPFAMLYHDDAGGTAGEHWRKLQRTWCRPAATIPHMKKHCLDGITGALGREQ